MIPAYCASERGIRKSRIENRMPTPDKISRFKIIKELGRGSQGVVYLATDPQLERQVAVKTLHLNVSGNGERQTRLIQEARTVGKLQHPNIIPVYEAGEFDGMPYLVFEFVEGLSLRDLMKREGPFAVHRAADIMRQILDGISYAHEQGIVHRDMSPSNVLINKNDIPRIMDFGISIMTEGAENREKDISGTPCYMSPEHFSKNPIGPRSDIFSLGLIFYEMVVGKPALRADNDFAVMYKIAHDAVPAPSQQNEAVDQGLDSIILRALEKEPDARYTNAREMRMALDDYISPRESDDTEEHSNIDTNATVDFLLRRMRHKSDFPTFSSYIMEINRKASSGRLNVTSASQLANTIIKDYALTSKLLKLVNSAFFGQFSGRVTTVSRAVVILGFEQIRTAAASLLLFEHLQNKSQSMELGDAAISSFMSGMIAEDLAGRLGFKDTEEAFICAMLRNLGKHLVIFYFPEEYQQIKRRMIQKDIDELAASRAILGISYQELGAGIAKAWKFPEKIVGSMKTPPQGNVDRAKSGDEMLRNLSSFSNTLCHIASTLEGEERDKALRGLLRRFEKSVPIPKAQISKLLDSAREKVEAYSGTLKINTAKSQFLRNLAGYSRESQKTHHPVKQEATSEEYGKTSEIPQYQGLEIKDVVSSPEESRDPNVILINGIQEITNTLLEDYEINNLLNMILETMYRGFSFHRVLLCLADGKHTQVHARFGFGENVEKIIEDFSFKIQRAPDVFNIALSQGKDLGIDDTGDPRIQKGIPEWYRRLVAAPAFVLYPVLINKKPLGLIYADRESSGRVLQGDKLHYMKTLCNQAVLAMKQITLKA